MLGSLNRQRDSILPPPNVLHERSAVGVDQISVNNELLDLHRFSNDIRALRYIQAEPISYHTGERAGTKHSFDTLTTGGIDRGVLVYEPVAEKSSNYSFSILLDTAWFTGLTGHNDRIAEIIMKELGVSVMLVGPEFSSKKPNLIDAPTDLREIAAISTGFSLAQSAEASASIYNTIQKEYSQLGLKELIVDAGESRGAMIAQIRRAYLSAYGLQSIASDLTDPNMAERAFVDALQTLKLLKWPVRELIGATAVGISHALNGELHHLGGTTPLDKRYLTGALIGTGPALFSGEEALGARYTAYEHPQFILNFKGSGAAHTETRRENYRDHHNTTIREVRGCHLSLAYPSVLSYLLARTIQLGETYDPINPSSLNTAMIHSTKPWQRLRKEVRQEKAA